MPRWVLLSLLWLSTCASTVVNTRLDPAVGVLSSTPVVWQVNQDCMAAHSLAGIRRRTELAAACHDDGTREFVALALSGGGAKAAVFAGETMFYLQALGLLSRADVISSVSGGSFAGALFALSCDPGDAACLTQHPHGLDRPEWRHDTVMTNLGQGYSSLVIEQVARLLVPGVPASISAARFADVIDRNYFKRPAATQPRFLFSDLNPRRPQLFLDTAIISENRGGLGSNGGPGCTLPRRGYLRRRTPDEFFHFAFSDYYFGLLHSTIDDYPVAAGVASSAAFPALIDNAILNDYCGEKGKDDKVRLMDGGVNDNQALIEIYLILAELSYGERRSDLVPERLERLNREDRAWVFAINSSVTETTGKPGTGTGEQPRGAIPFFSAFTDKVLTTIDTYSAEGYNLRKQLYLAERDRLRQFPQYAPVFPVEISLTQLDQYRLGGTEAALRTKSGVGPEQADVGGERVAARIIRQRAAYDRIVGNLQARRDLRLSDWHPQCYFDMREKLDASLVSLGADEQTCLREAARWSAALRAQELCDGAAANPAIPPPDGLVCTSGQARLPHPEALADPAPLPGDCGRLMPKAPASRTVPQDPYEAALTCHPL